jgi:hypothetical protein
MEGGMRQEWRQRQVDLLSQVAQLLEGFKGELSTEQPLTGGIRIDFVLRTGKAYYLVEIKGSSPGEYLSFATWGQITMYKKAMESWQTPNIPIIPVLFTNATLSDDLRETFEKSKIVVVKVQPGEDLSTTRQKMKRELQEMGLPIPEMNGHQNLS